MNNRRKMLLRLSQLQFAAWELHMYLDTHPEDSQAAIRYEQFSFEYKRLLREFQEKYGPIVKPAYGNEWLNGPWPWEITKEGDC